MSRGLGATDARRRTNVACGVSMQNGRRAMKPWGSRRPQNVSLFWVVAVLYLAPCAIAAGPEGTRRIVVLYPVSDGQPGIIPFDQVLRSTLNSLSRDQVEMY